MIAEELLDERALARVKTIAARELRHLPREKAALRKALRARLEVDVRRAEIGAEV